MVTKNREHDALTRDYLDSLAELDTALRELQTELTRGRATIALIRTHVDRGGQLAELLATSKLQAVRRGIGIGLKGLERARHVRDRLLFRCLQAEGLSASEIGRSFGISRGLVSRLLNEPD
jgi:hypothetical protein